MPSPMLSSHEAGGPALALRNSSPFFLFRLFYLLPCLVSEIAHGSKNQGSLLVSSKSEERNKHISSHQLRG